MIYNLICFFNFQFVKGGNLIHFIRYIFIIFLIFCKDGKGTKIQDTMPFPIELIDEIFRYSSLGTKENFKMVSKRFYILFYQFFGIDETEVNLFTFEDQKNESLFLSYRAFKEFKSLKKMFSLFLNSDFLKNNVEKKKEIKKFKFKFKSIPYILKKAILEDLEIQDGPITELLYQAAIELLEEKIDCSSFLIKDSILFFVSFDFNQSCINSKTSNFDNPSNSIKRFK